MAILVWSDLGPHVYPRAVLGTNESGMFMSFLFVHVGLLPSALTFCACPHHVVRNNQQLIADPTTHPCAYRFLIGIQVGLYSSYYGVYYTVVFTSLVPPTTSPGCSDVLCAAGASSGGGLPDPARAQQRSHCE